MSSLHRYYTAQGSGKPETRDNSANKANLKSSGGTTKPHLQSSCYAVTRFSNGLQQAKNGRIGHAATQTLHGRMHRYTAKVILRKDIPRKDGTCLLSLQAFVNKKRVVIPLNIYVRPEEFVEADTKVLYKKGGTVEKKDVDDYNLILGDAKARASDIFMSHRIHDNPLTADEFKKLYLDKTSRHDFLAFFEKEIKRQEDLKSINTIKAYKNTLSKLIRFRKTIEYRQLNYEMISDFDRWLFAKEHLMVNSVWKQHKILKTFINIAIKKGVNFENPYKHFKLKTSQGNRVYLEKSEVDKLKQALEKNQFVGQEHNVLRLFLFCCFTSLRISDVMRFSLDWIIDNEIVYVPIKTKHKNKIVRVPLSETAQQFVEECKKKPFSKVSEAHANDTIKVIAGVLEVKKSLSFHVARHTFALLFLKSGGKVEILKEVMGHSKIETTMIYVHIEGNDRKEQMKLMDKLFKKEEVTS